MKKRRMGMCMGLAAITTSGATNKAVVILTVLLKA